jgi:polyisoprenyl-phosphate glycosyltransferase
LKSFNLIIPCYNEEGNIKNLFHEIKYFLNTVKKYKYLKIKILLIENGSTDQTRYKIKKEIKKIKIKSNIKIIYIDKNKGYGFGIIQGIKFSKSDFIGWTHSDLQTDLNDVYRSLSALNNFKQKKSNKIIIKGNRHGRSIFHEIITKLMSIVVFVFTLNYISDINAQPKIFPSKLSSKILKNPPNDFNLDLHLLLLAKKYGYEIKYLNVNFKKRLSSKAKGAGSLKGIVLVSITVFRYLIMKLFKSIYK